MSQGATSWVPTKKVGSGGVGAALTVAILDLLEAAGTDLSVPLSTAIPVLVYFLVAYLVPEQAAGYTPGSKADTKNLQ